MCLRSSLQQSERTLNCVPIHMKTHFQANKTVYLEYVTHTLACMHTHTRTYTHTHTHTDAPQPFLRPLRAPAPALKQFIEASLHGHSFWNSNCYLICLQVLSPLHLHLNLVHLLSTCIAQHRYSAPH